MAKWTEEQKLKALAIAEASTCKEASDTTGIPEGTIKRWRMECRTNEPNRTERTEPSKKIQNLTDEVVERVKAEVKEYVADRVKETADKILDVVALSLENIESTINKGPNYDEPKAGWLRALVGVVGQGVEKHQLLSGKPTARVDGQVTQINEQRQHIINEIITTPDLAKRIEDNFRQRARMGTGES